MPPDIKSQTVNWLLNGDVSIQYQTHRDLFSRKKKSLRKRIESEGWGKRLLTLQNSNGSWGKGFYQPKWTSTHYTLLDLRNLDLPPDNLQARKALNGIFRIKRSPDGGIYPIGKDQRADVCINGMLLNYASYFESKPEELKLIVDFLISHQMDDGGFNCESNRIAANHSTLHSSLSVAEGISEYLHRGYSYKRRELSRVEKRIREFLLIHKLFRSHRTGQVIDERMLKLSYPTRWRYDILRALDYFRKSGCSMDSRMEDAIQVLLAKRSSDGTWPLQQKHPGQTHFDFEKTGRPSRWNTLRALRVLWHFPGS